MLQSSFGDEDIKYHSGGVISFITFNMNKNQNHALQPDRKN